MFIFKKAIAPFLLPPGLFVLILLILAIWRWGSKHHRGALFCLGMAVMIWLPATDPGADLLMHPLEAPYAIPNHSEADVIILLGGGVLAGAPDLSGSGAPGPGTMVRMVTAARLQRRLKIPLIVSGGRVFEKGVGVARIAQRFLIDLGVAPDKIILEDQSRDTYENARFSQKICQRHGFKAPLLITSGYHLRRSMFVFDQLGMPVTPFPCDLTTWPGKSYHWRNFLPSAAALHRSSAALHEWLGLFYYWIAY